MKKDEQFEEDFMEWCKQNEMDPESDEAREGFRDYWDEYGPSFWENMDPNDREGWEGNILRSFD